MTLDKDELQTVWSKTLDELTNETGVDCQTFCRSVADLAITSGLVAKLEDDTIRKQCLKIIKNNCKLIKSMPMLGLLVGVIK